MNLYELYTRVVETTGLLVVTPESLCVAVRNCYADLASRGYREFRERKVLPEDFLPDNAGMVRFYQPKDYRKTVYAKVLCDNDMKIAARMSLANPALLSKFNPTTGELRTNFINLSTDTIYYVKDKLIHIEVAQENLTPRAVLLGYYAKLTMPPVVDNVDDLRTINLRIREEYEDAIVLYVSYFYYARFIKDQERIDFFQRQYKYYVEDISHELAAEDMYNEEDSVIPYED